MSLLELIHGKKQLEKIATLTLATPATLDTKKTPTVAIVTTVTVANFEPVTQNASAAMWGKDFLVKDMIYGLTTAIEIKSNEELQSEAQETARYYYEHHFKCKRCISAGFGYGSRCQKGYSLKMSYKEAFFKTDIMIPKTALYF